jgi:hypothetical protein
MQTVQSPGMEKQNENTDNLKLWLQQKKNKKQQQLITNVKISLHTWATSTEVQLFLLLRSYKWRQNIHKEPGEGIKSFFYYYYFVNNFQEKLRQKKGENFVCKCKPLLNDTAHALTSDLLASFPYLL